MAIYTDYKISVDGDRVIELGEFAIVEDVEVIKQNMISNIKLSKKDWFLNFDEGIEYFSVDEQENGLLGAREITTAQEGQLQAAAENTVGVISLDNFEFDLLTKSLIVRIEALTIFGSVNLEVEV